MSNSLLPYHAIFPSYTHIVSAIFPSYTHTRIVSATDIVFK